MYMNKLSCKSELKDLGLNHGPTSKGQLTVVCQCEQTSLVCFLNNTSLPLIYNRVYNGVMRYQDILGVS